MSRAKLIGGVSAFIPMLFLLVGSPASAVDGVIELNQVCAEQSGCVTGDAAAFPITLSAPGSYVLTSNLEVPSLNTTAIVVAADDVTIDLAGFSIRPRVDCRPDCGGSSGTGSGIDATGRENVSVRDGTILGMGNSAVLAGDLASVDEIRAIGSGGTGIAVGQRSAIRRTTVQGTGGVGISLGHESSLSDSLVRSAASHGIQGGASIQVANSRLIGNGGEGIHLTGSKGSVVESVITGNTGAGVVAQDALVVHNVISANQLAGVFFLGGAGGVVSGNQLEANSTGADVASVSGTIVTNNSIVGNTALGINMTTSDGAGENVLSGNPMTVVGGVEIGANACNGNTTCP